MVSFWPFKGDDSSAASFEKVLSQLSTKITKVGSQNDGFRQRQRRYKVLWTLYSTFAYILAAAILTLVTGYQRWSVAEYTAMAGSPVLIFGIRTAIDAYYNYRISNSQSHLNDLLKQREKAIQKLKAATKYDSTQQLLDKYGGGGSSRQRQPSPRASKKRKSEGGDSKQPTPQGPRTGFAPPPTANIQRPPGAGPMPPGAPGQPRRNVSGSAPEWPPSQPSEEFAPNAFPVTPQPPPIMPQQSQQYHEGPKWYDRIFDVVLGEDEIQAKNRIALICQQCRLVNGQAPPGARSLEDVGRWRCSSCQAWNGVESEEKRILKQVTRESDEVRSPRAQDAPQTAMSEATSRRAQLDGSDDEVYEHVDEEVGDDNEAGAGAAESPPSGSTRGKTRQRKKA